MKRTEYGEIINRLLRHPELNPSEFYLIYEHRGSKSGLEAVLISELCSVSRSALVLKNGTELPIHRVVAVRNLITGELLAGQATCTQDLDVGGL